MSSLQDMHENAASLYEERKLQEALDIYNQIILINPTDEVALSCVQDIYHELDDKLNYYLSRANVNIAQGKIEYAINDTKKALAQDIDNIEARRKLARLYKVSGQNVKAIDEFLRLIHNDDNELEAYFELVDLYMAENSIESAIGIAKQGLEKFSDNANLKNMTAQLYFKNNDYESALIVVADEMLKTKILLQKEDNDKAKEILDKFDVTKLDDLKKKNYYVLMAQYYYNVSNFEKSLDSINKYVDLNGPDAVSFQMKALIYEAKNDNLNAYINWGYCSKFQGKIDDAIVEFNHAYQENNQEKIVLIELAKLYEVIKERFVSIEFWQKVYDIDKDEEAKNILAEFYYSQGDFKKAEEFGKITTKDQNPQEEYTGLIDKIMNLFTKK